MHIDPNNNMKEFILKCLDFDHRNRYSPSQALQYLKNFKSYVNQSQNLNVNIFNHQFGKISGIGNQNTGNLLQSNMHHSYIPPNNISKEKKNEVI